MSVENREVTQDKFYLPQDLSFVIIGVLMQPQSRGRIVLVVIVLLVLGGVFYAGFTAGMRNVPDISLVTELTNKEGDKPSEVDFSAFWRAWRVLNDKYIPTKVATTTVAVTDQDKVWGAISGLTASLKDPYTIFFPPEEAKIFESEISGTFEGVGMEIGIKDKILTVVAPLKDTPAERAGIRSGDRILKIDGIPTDGMGTDIAVRKIRGKQGTTVRLTVSREGRPEAFDLSVTRGVINVPVIDTQVKLSDGTISPDKTVGLRSDGVFIIRLYSFTAQSPDLFRGALREFIQSGSTKLLLDLRGNPGGYLEAAVDMASWFLPVGDVVVQEEYAKDDVRIYRSHGYDVFNENLRMVILIDGGSASASEILAGALREYKIAELVGAKTFGKGSVQELVPLTADTSLKVTVARWLTPSGKSISEEGLIPDYEVEITQEDLTQQRDPQMDKAISVLLGK